MRNIKIVKNKEADRWFLRNFHSYNDNSLSEKIINLIKNNNLKADKILEIGCANGNKLNQYSKLLKSKKSSSILWKDLSQEIKHERATKRFNEQYYAINNSKRCMQTKCFRF